MASKKILQAIEELKGAEAASLLSAKKCSSVRRVLEKAAGLSQAPEKGKKNSDAVIISIANRRKQNLLKKGIK